MRFSVIALASLPLVAFASPTTKDVSLYARALITGNGIEARVELTGHLDGRLSTVSVEGIEGLFDNTNSPYLYHFHTNPISPDGDCNSALGHLDPMNATESLTCDPNFPLFCQMGDISGKHGPLVGTSSGMIPKFAFSSNLVRFFPQDFSILGRSIVIHSANKTRLACGNITSVLDGTAFPNLKPSGLASNFITNYPTAPPFNPPVIATPFVGNNTPTDAQLEAMTFPLPNPLIPINASTLWVALTEVQQTALFNGGQSTVTLAKEVIVAQFPLPFTGATERW
ncbi:hypothetical protein FRB96_004983 [Tulasnella sp. 330]|nr:hypothetical protein FRB96_004983 [Tulasnella sp. 330]KAG8886064.1 hypothetical protein FRB97_007940 [Tulasnella sp. 331]KAG8890257.1 hypothetical protein FRB98_000168 [Tulasnella sp. 332]